MTKTRILLVEDEFVIRLSLSEFLENKGFAILQAETSYDARKIINSHPVDLLITDLSLPGLWNGVQLAEFVRKKHKNIPVIFTSGTFSHPNSTLFKNLTSTHKDIFITKPYQLDFILETIKKLLSV
ncbi:response regulator [Entomobacter blattae]|uniref:Aerobic respiration control protein ArcA n=1 Tax=Entomobacter blattae TaxID=2762277 RepID=A0A7H1NTF7_9PROT|nr:response regulator [Entomobacter blattae]QNT79067.1 Aerobic respiration control protein ArcA [Entomobacter blattae]